MIDPFQIAQEQQPDCKDPYKLFGPICMELSNPGKRMNDEIVWMGHKEKKKPDPNIKKKLK